MSGTSSALGIYIDQIINTAIDLGASKLTPKIVNYTDFDSLFFISYTQPTKEQVGKYSSEIVWICNDPDSIQYKKAYREHAFFEGLWQEILDSTDLMRRQLSFYTEFVYAPADTRNGDQFHAPLLPRALSLGERYTEEEVVPLSFIRTLVGDGGGGGPSDPTLVRRVDVLEQEVLKLQAEIENIDTSFNFTQDYLASAWLVEHNMGEHPSIIQVMNETGCPMFPKDIVFDPETPNQFVVIFSAPERGRVAAIR